MGTPDFAAHVLSELVQHDHRIVAVVTSPDKPAGRGRKMQSSAVKHYAEEKGYRLLQPVSLKDPVFLQDLRSISADLFVVVAFRMLPEEVWSLPRLGTINLHASLLPQYRGAAPIQWAIINGETETGVTTFFIEKEIDTGKIIQYRKVPIEPHEEAGSLHDKLMVAGAGLLSETIGSIASGTCRALEQDQVMPPDGILKKAPKIFKKDCEVNWTRPGKEIFNFVRGLSPYPAAWALIQNKEEEPFSLKIFSVTTESFPPGQYNPGTTQSDGKTYLRIASGDAWIYLTKIQPEGKNPMNIESFLRGVRNRTFITPDLPGKP